MKTSIGAVLAACTLAVAGAGDEAAKPATEALQDIEVTVRHTDGSIEKFGKEVASLDIVVDEYGRIQMVHMIVVGGTEKDTHVWYNFANVAGLKYRFLQITGKGKVRVKQVKGFTLTPGDKTLKPSINGIEVDDYK